MFNLRAIREDVLDNIFENLDVISKHKECDAIIEFLCPDIYTFDFYDDFVKSMIKDELFDYFDDPDCVSEENYERAYESIEFSINDNFYASDFEINGKTIIWRI